MKNDCHLYHTLTSLVPIASLPSDTRSRSSSTMSEYTGGMDAVNTALNQLKADMQKHADEIWHVYRCFRVGHLCYFNKIHEISLVQTSII